jgi:hypothetical protein
MKQIRDYNEDNPLNSNNKLYPLDWEQLLKNSNDIENIYEIIIKII